LTAPPLPIEIERIPLDSQAPLIIVDVDEVLAMFMRGFEQFVGGHGYEMRITRFALFQNIFRIEDGTELDLDRGRELFDLFFESHVETIDVAPGARDGLAALANLGSVVILTNAPAHGREPRARWLLQNGFPYPLVINAGLKGPAVAALAERTRGPVAFVDDLLPNLESVAQSAPRVRRFQMVADERLRQFAPEAPERHARIDDWPGLSAAMIEALTVQD
jgi:hypothetical protein